MSTIREELEYAGLDPDATNDSGYECPVCGYEPTNFEPHTGRRCCKKISDKVLDTVTD